jgi:phenylpyruvate tautomerase PptA (4-oxalocrotonate tautomerase family)
VARRRAPARRQPRAGGLADGRALRRAGLILARVPEELEDVAVRVEEEDLRVAVTPRHRAARELYAVLGETGTCAVQVVDLEREMVRHPPVHTRAGIPLPRATRRVGVREEMDLGPAEPEPRAVEGEVRRPRHLLEPERLGVEAARAVEVGDDEPDVLDAHVQETYRNLAGPDQGGTMPLIRVELFDYRMSDETSAALIEKLTDALGEATHPGLKEHTWVIVEGHNPKNWGLAGKPWPIDQMPPASAS